MGTIQWTLIRSVFAIVLGIVTVKWPDQVLGYIVSIIGIMFIATGIVALLNYFSRSAAVGVLYGSIGIYPDDVHALHAVGQCLPFLLGHAEQRRGQSVGQAAVLSDDSEGRKVICGIKTVLIDYVVIALAVHHKIPLVNS